VASSLYRPDELLDVPTFLRGKYGADEPPPGQSNIWRVALTKQLHESYTFFASNFAYVADKRGELTTLKPFVGQAILRYTLDSQLRAELPGRVAEVKARQLGWTVENIARGLHFCLDENKRSLILVNDEDVAAEQATRLGTMLNGLPGWMQPMRRIQNLKHLVFDNPNPKDRIDHPGLNAAFQITVPSSFRGVPPGFVCISEYAHMEEDRQMAVQGGIISAMPLTSYSILVIDTTPNGPDGYYDQMVYEAEEDNPKWTKRIENWKGELAADDVMRGVLGEPEAVAKGYPGVFVPAVCPWRLHEEYTCRSKTNPRGELKPLTKPQRDETEATLGQMPEYGGEEEIESRDKYGLSTERAFWRRRKIDGYKLPTVEMRLLQFRQEFLSTIASAFIDSGTAPFDRGSLDALGRMERDPIAKGLFRMENERIVLDQTAMTQWQEVRIYAPPERGEKYTLGVDTDVAYDSPDSDATVGQVVRFRDNKVVLTYEARVPSHLLFEQLFFIYEWYNKAFYAIEAVGMGYDLMRRCYDGGMMNAYEWKRLDQQFPEPSTKPYLGWQTDIRTRPMMDYTFTELLCRRDRDSGKPDPFINVPDAKTIREIRGLTREMPSGKFKSSRGHDDHYDALCIALCIARDPYAGLHRASEAAEEEKRKEFEWRFSAINTMASFDRNRPDLSRI
jgi:hypothetical protein